MDGLSWKTLFKWMIWGYPYFRNTDMVKRKYSFSFFHVACFFFCSSGVSKHDEKKQKHTHYEALFNFSLYHLYQINLNKAFQCFVYARTRLRVEIGETFCIKQLAELGTFFRGKLFPKASRFRTKSLLRFSDHRMSCAKIPKLRCADRKPTN